MIAVIPAEAGIQKHEQLFVTLQHFMGKGLKTVAHSRETFPEPDHRPLRAVLQSTLEDPARRPRPGLRRASCRWVHPPVPFAARIRPSSVPDPPPGRDYSLRGVRGGSPAETIRHSAAPGLSSGFGQTTTILRLLHGAPGNFSCSRAEVVVIGERGEYFGRYETSGTGGRHAGRPARQ